MNCLKEVTQSQFFMIQGAIERGETEKITGKLIVEKNGDDRLYHNSRGNWLRSYRGIYFAHPKLIKKFGK